MFNIFFDISLLKIIIFFNNLLKSKKNKNKNHYIGCDYGNFVKEEQRTELETNKILKFQEIIKIN